MKGFYCTVTRVTQEKRRVVEDGDDAEEGNKISPNKSGKGRGKSRRMYVWGAHELRNGANTLKESDMLHIEVEIARFDIERKKMELRTRYRMDELEMCHKEQKSGKSIVGEV